MTYRAPLADIGSALKHATMLLPAIEQGLLGELGIDDIDAIVGEAGRFAAEKRREAGKSGARVA